MKEKIFIASDHAGFQLKAQLTNHFEGLFDDLGAKNDESVDYPDYAHFLVSNIHKISNSKGVLICGSGVGMSIVANRDPKIRAGLAFNSKIAELIRQHNDANVLVLPGRFIDIHEAIKCVDKFLKTNFEAGRHQKRIEKI